MIQRNAMRCWETGEPFQQVLAADEEISAQLERAGTRGLF